MSHQDLFVFLEFIKLTGEYVVIPCLTVLTFYTDS